MSQIRWGRTRAGAKWHAVEWEANRTLFVPLCHGWAWVKAETVVSPSWAPHPSERCAHCARKVREGGAA